MKKAIFIFLVMLYVSSITTFASDGKETIGKWETKVYFDNIDIITRVALDKDNEVAIKLREFAETIGYSVKWNENERSITLLKEDEKIKIFTGKYICEKDRKEVNLEKPIFIDATGSAYLPQSFLLSVMDIDTVLIEQEAGFRRVNGVFLTDTKAINNELVIVDSSEFALKVKPKGRTKEGETILFSFFLGIEREDISISMDYEEFLKSNDARVAMFVKEQLEKINCEELNNPDVMAEFKTNTVNEINKALGMQFVKYIYITEFTWYTPL